MNLTSDQFKQLQTALLSGYPSWNSLERMVRMELEQNLEAIASAKNLNQGIFDLIKWAESQGRVADLVMGANAQNPHNAEIKALITLVDGAGVAMERASTAAMDTPTEQGSTNEGTGQQMRDHIFISHDRHAAAIPCGPIHA